MADERTAADVLEDLALQHAERARAAQEHQRQVLRDEGVAGVVRVSVTEGQADFVATGPDLYGAIVLFAMTDGTVRWTRP